MSLLRRIEKKGPSSSPSAPTPAPTSPQQAGFDDGGVQRRAVPRARDAYMDLKTRVQNRLIAELDPSMDVSRTAEVRGTIRAVSYTHLTLPTKRIV